MECKFAFVCDFAQRERKLNALGIGWDVIYAPKVPAAHPMMTFVASIRGTLAETGTKEAVLRLIDADGEDVIPPIQQQVPFDIKAPRLHGDINLVFNLGGVEFKKHGSYAFHLTLQGVEMASANFSVLQPPTTT